MKIVVGIATTGRREQMALTLQQLARQARLPDAVMVCPACDDDFDPACAHGLPYPVAVVRGSRGSCAQRNCILAHCAGYDIVLFMDDDFYPAVAFLAEAERLMQAHPEVVAADGRPIADGATGPGIPHDEALRLLRNDTVPGMASSEAPTAGYGTYGCNMIVRLAPVREHGIRFDENLPLYGWQEDVDFARHLARHGSIVRSPRLRGVHLAIKRGRTSGLRFGYSQVANPIYLMGKGSMTWAYGLRLMSRNFARNLLGAMAPEPWIDRRGRLRGNLLAVADLLLGRLDPRRILVLE